ncbi:unnamed protein product [Diplocarpon coronariae]
MNTILARAIPATAPPSRSFSSQPPRSATERPNSSCSKQFSLCREVSDWPLGWRRKIHAGNPSGISSIDFALGEPVLEMTSKKWDGAARRSTYWDGLKRDPDLWYPSGNCLVHLYKRGRSRRGPAIRIPMEALIQTGCRPLLDRFLFDAPGESPASELSAEGYPGQASNRTYELYIPAPPNADRGEAFLYHTATRNFFAWMFGKSLAGVHLGGALVGLLNSMDEFRSMGKDNVQEILDYMDEEGYADMRNAPEHALAVLYFAEHFRIRDLWLDAFAHCSGMNENLTYSPGFEFMSRKTRALVTRSRYEMDVRLDQCGQRLKSFLSDDFSDSTLGLPSGARAHLDKFRDFLQSYYIAKLGYYPPAYEFGNNSFPKDTYSQMCSEFHKLYEYLVDWDHTPADGLPAAQQGGLCVWQCIQAFDQRHKYQSLEHPFPLLPESEEKSKLPLKRHFSLSSKGEKMKPDPRLITLANLAKATNVHDQALLECTLVRAYRCFEKDCVFYPTKGDRNEKFSQTDARKIRWILVYSILQTLLSATIAPDEVRDTQNVPYNICVLTAGCPPWKEQPYETLLRTQTDQMKVDFKADAEQPATASMIPPCSELKPDIDYSAINRARQISDTSLSSMKSSKGTVRRALSTLGNMPALIHPRPQRASFHEIIVRGHGNGTKNMKITTRPATGDSETHCRNDPSESGSSSIEEISSRWSTVSKGASDSPASSTNNSRRGSGASIEASKNTIRNFLDKPMSALGLARVPLSVYSTNVHDEAAMHPSPLQLKSNEQNIMKDTTELKIDWEGNRVEYANDELVKDSHL